MWKISLNIQKIVISVPRSKFIPGMAMRQYLPMCIRCQFCQIFIMITTIVVKQQQQHQQLQQKHLKSFDA